MAVKIVIIFSVLVATAYSSLVPLVANQGSSGFSYDVADPYTGDYKSQTEVREGDAVIGQYSLLDPDGTYRIVDYTADDLNGFNAVVRKEPVATGVAASTVVQSPVLSNDLFEASPVIAARTVAPVVSSVYQNSAPGIVTSNTIATPVVAAKTYATPVIASEAYASPALFARSYSPSIYAANTYALPSISKTYSSPSVVATNAYSSPVVYAEPSLFSSDYYGDSYLSPYYSAYGRNIVPVDAFRYYKK